MVATKNAYVSNEGRPHLNVKIVLVALVAVIMVQSTVLALPYLSHFPSFRAASTRAYSQSASFQFSVFNQPISNDTEHELNPALPRSWEIDIQSSLVPSSKTGVTEAEMAFAPAYPLEYKSIPTIIVQERADGLLRVEYFAQNWPNTSGLLLYNSSTPGWTGGNNISILFQSSGPPSEVNPQLAPRPNGSVDIIAGGMTVLSNYPIAWANLSDLYLFGYPGSSFTSGTIQISFYELSTG
jgi:hypothetical protein